MDIHLYLLELSWKFDLKIAKKKKEKKEEEEEKEDRSDDR